MTEPDTGAFFAAGSAALAHNSPLSGSRAEELVVALERTRPDSVVDLGCGTGSFLIHVAAALPDTQCLGIDLDPVAIATATRSAAGAGVADRCRFVEGDAGSWPVTSSAAVCIGASHAFGGPVELFDHLASRGVNTLVVGDGVWQKPPDDWCTETFGYLPAGVDDLARIAIGSGWTVTSRDTSTLDEWDSFESTWIAGVRALGTDDAVTFAASREADYARYRGRLGFAWLILTR